MSAQRSPAPGPETRKESPVNPPGGAGSLSAALLQAQRAARGVEKDSVNSFHKYKYASSEDVIQEARGCLHEAGLTLSPIGSELGGSEARPMLHAVYLLEHERGEQRQIVFDCPVVEEKGRPLDKAVAAARTYSLSYCLRDLLLLPRVEEGANVDDRDDRGHQPRPPAPPPSGPSVQRAQVPKQDPESTADESLVPQLEASIQAINSRATGEELYRSVRRARMRPAVKEKLLNDIKERAAGLPERAPQ